MGKLDSIIRRARETSRDPVFQRLLAASRAPWTKTMDLGGFNAPRKTVSRIVEERRQELHEALEPVAAKDVVRLLCAACETTQHVANDPGDYYGNKDRALYFWSAVQRKLPDQAPRHLRRFVESRLDQAREVGD